MSSPVLLRNYITKYVSFKGVEREINRLEIKYPSYKPHVFLNQEITILLNILTSKQLNGLIRNTFITMKRMNVLTEDIKVPIFEQSWEDESQVDFMHRVCDIHPCVKEHFIIALYTYF